LPYGPLEMIVRQPRNQQAQVDEKTIDGVEAFARFGQQVETRLQSRACRFRVSRNRRFGRSDHLPLQVDFVEIAEMPHFSREQFQQQVARSQRQKIGRQFGIDRGARVERRQRRLQHFSPVRQIANDGASLGFQPLGPSGGEPAFSA
jgi:hypothetical protein